MTAVLEKAFKQAAGLPAALQQQLAEQILDEILGEAAWDHTLASDASQDLLRKMAECAVKASRAGKTHRKGFGE